MSISPTPASTGVHSKQNPLPVYFIGHAGVNLLFSDSENLRRVQANLREIGKEIRAISPKPRAILVFSGHFEAGEIHGPGVIEVNVKKQTHVQHDYVNDFHDSHPYVYDYDWKHEDAPELALEIWRRLSAAGIKTKRVQRNMDHGVWVPFKIMFPDDTDDPLDIPIVQVSTFQGYELEQQIKLGEAVHALRSQGYVIIGSGMAVHSFPSIGEVYKASPEAIAAIRTKNLDESVAFDKAVRSAVEKPNSTARAAALLALQKLPDFKRSHPTVEHLTPLFVAAAAAGDTTSVEPLGKEVVDVGMSYLNVRFV